MSVARIKKNDTVIAIAGESAGQTGKVLRVMADKGMVVVQGLNVVKKLFAAHSPPRTAVLWIVKRRWICLT